MIARCRRHLLMPFRPCGWRRLRPCPEVLVSVDERLEIRESQQHPTAASESLAARLAGWWRYYVVLEDLGARQLWLI